MVKYKQYYKAMMADHGAEFTAFREIHDLFKTDPKKYLDKFNEIGAPVAAIVADYENRLCSNMEGGKNAVFSMALADKFREEVKKEFSQIDMVGVKMKFN